MNSYFSILSFDLNTLILSKLPFPIVFSVFRSQPYFRKWKSDDNFWKSYYFHRRNALFTSFHVKNKSYSNARELFSHLDHVHRLHSEKKDYDTILYIMARYGCYEKIEDSIKLGATDYNGGLIEAAANGYLKIIQLMVKLGATNYNEGLIEAAKQDK